MAYDPAMGDVVLFGGAVQYSNTFATDDTWIWDGTTWNKVSPAASPPARNGASMAYDPATHTIVLFGGLGGSGVTSCESCWLDDTWTWDGTTWTQASPAASPPARIAASMAYDPATQTVVLFGGTDYSGDYFGDTWTWNGTTWTQASPGNTWTWNHAYWTHTTSATTPLARSYAAMTYDPATAQVVLFGGSGPAGTNALCPLGDTWTWDRDNWTEVSSGGTSTWSGHGCNYTGPTNLPSARNSESMTYDSATNTVVLFGGDATGEGQCLVNDTWTWDGTTWTEMFPAAKPPAREGASMAYDSATDTAVLFGGVSQSCPAADISDAARDTAGTHPGGTTGNPGPSALNDTWTWNGTTWTQA